MKLILTSVSLVHAAILATSVYVYEIDSDVNLRKGPDNKKKILRTVSGGEKINVLEKTNQWWWKVEYQGTEGYIASSFIVVSLPETAWNVAMVAWGLVETYPAIMGIALFLVVFGMLRKVQRKRSKKKRKK